MTFLEELARQRWDDHRYYHHSTINQSLHLFSAITFLVAYAIVLAAPAVASLIGWLIAMPSRQIGHFFFEPKDYDHANRASHAHKESIKVGYNLRRKVVLHAIWLVSPLLMVTGVTSAAGLSRPVDFASAVHNASLIWLALAASALVCRTIQLFFLQSVQAGLVWFTKILTDPVHDIMLYYRSPMYVLRGELYDPIAPLEDA
jgi:hypothetical protein